MRTTSRVVIGVVAVEHLWFGVLESVLWTTDLGRRTFNTSVEFADASQALAANQGVYNVFLATALLLSLAGRDAGVARALALFGLGCVVVAGLFGGITVAPAIAVVQALPAAVGLGLVLREPVTPTT